MGYTHSSSTIYHGRNTPDLITAKEKHGVNKHLPNVVYIARHITGCLKKSLDTNGLKWSGFALPFQVDRNVHVFAQY